MAKPLDAPVAPRKPHTWHRPTGDVDDPWAWLLDRDDPDTVDYLTAENAFTEQWFAPHAALRETLFGEIKGRILETDLSVPVRKGEWWYVTRTEEGRNYAIHCRGRSAETATEAVTLDENAEADGHDYFAVGAFDVSPSHDLLAWSSDTAGSEEYQLRVRDLSTGAELPDRLERTYYGTAWSADDQWLFYTVPDEAMRPHQIWRHRLGTAQTDDVLVVQEDDERFYLGVDLSRDDRWIVVTAESKQSSEVWVIPSDEPTAAPRSVLGRVDDHEYSVEPWGDRFVVVTNDEAEDFRVVTVPTTAAAGGGPIGRDEWTELVPHQPGRRITTAEAFDDHLVVHEWAEAQPRLRILFADGGERIVDTGDEPSDVELDANPEYATGVVRFRFQSLTTPASVFEEDVRSGERTLLKQTPVLGVDLSAYRSTRTWATSADGTRVPVDVVWRDGTMLDGTAPLLLYGYGSYEASMPPWFSAARISMLDRGWVWALAHPRGGGELGRHWYLDGKLLSKRNTFDDFIASAEHLVAERFTAPDRVAIRGGSAGGLLVGAAMTMRPELYAAVVAEVPFVDVVSTMSDPTLPLTVTEWEEWGDPRTEPFASYMASYSPYDNTTAGAYPALYVTAGLNDPRVSYHEPAKWVAKLRATSAGRGPILLKTEMGAGHGGPSGRYDAWRDEAQTLAFLFLVVGGASE
jgi:oligopeptidase B